MDKVYIVYNPLNGMNVEFDDIESAKNYLVSTCLELYLTTTQGHTISEKIIENDTVKITAPSREELSKLHDEYLEELMKKLE
jgi:hypothetical protein